MRGHGASRLGMAFALALTVSGSGRASAQIDATWTPVTFSEQNAAAWVLWRVLCDPSYPGAAPPAGVAAAYCDGLRASGMAYLEVILALTAMANTLAIPPFPMPGGVAGNIVATEGPIAQPGWVVEPNTGAVQLEQMVPVVVQALLGGYMSMMRTTLLAQSARLEALGGPIGAAGPAEAGAGGVPGGNNAVVDGAVAVPAAPAP